MIVSIDIGSTWTKGALFELQGDMLLLRRRAKSHTRVDDLRVGFCHVLEELVINANERLAQQEIRLFYSSSAKGGLAVAALGIVPEVTSEMAKMAAASAGAKLTSVYSYHLTSSDIAQLEQNSPDILLFAGGTDGGNSQYVIDNARALAQSKLKCPMIYAGNRTVRDQVADCLSGSNLVLVDNLLPNMESPSPEPARDAIRSLFLSKIVKGKGLDALIEQTGEQPLPTPLSVFEFTKLIRKHVPGWDEFMLVDVGGATTDIYSVHREIPSSGKVLRGLPESEFKRTVEGDLGMRVSAASVAASAKEIFSQALTDTPHGETKFSTFIDKVVGQPAFVPEDVCGRRFDELLAGACIAHATNRHAGRKHQVWTADGMMDVQLGRDLSQVKRVIGSGGYLSRMRHFDPQPWLSSQKVDSQGKQILLPEAIKYYRDDQYLIPLLANVAQEFPAAAAHAGVRYLASH